jgi:hypothetical protein
VSKRFEPVEKIDVGSVGSLKEVPNTENQSKTPQIKGLKPLNDAQETAPGSFSTRWFVFVTLLHPLRKSCFYASQAATKLMPNSKYQYQRQPQ